MITLFTILIAVFLIYCAIIIAYKVGYKNGIVYQLQKEIKTMEDKIKEIKEENKHYKHILENSSQNEAIVDSIISLEKNKTELQNIIKI